MVIAERTAISEAATKRREDEAVALLMKHIGRTGTVLKRHSTDELPLSAV